VLVNSVAWFAFFGDGAQPAQNFWAPTARTARGRPRSAQTHRQRRSSELRLPKLPVLGAQTKWAGAPRQPLKTQETESYVRTERRPR
jgi:hypothetical protein